MYFIEKYIRNNKQTSAFAFLKIWVVPWIRTAIFEIYMLHLFFYHSLQKHTFCLDGHLEFAL